MAGLILSGGMVYIGHRFQKKDLLIRPDGTLEVLPNSPHSPADVPVVDLKGQRVIPGFLDIHSHGGVGVDANAATPADLGKLARFHASHGTTAFLASVLTDTPEQTNWCIDQYKTYRDNPQVASELLGIHLEGPFLASEYKGAMPEHLLRKGDAKLAAAYQERAEGGIRYITVSPEVEGVAEMIPQLQRLGITVAIGHSGATYAQANAAIDAGARAATHTANAMRLFHQHEPAIFGAVLERDEVFCEMICDGRHLVPGSVRLFCKVKGMDRMVAITDSIMAAGLPDGNYKLGVNDVIVEDGDAKLPNGTRAGSTLTLDVALRNVLAWTEMSLEQILPAFTENPAKLIGVFDRKGSIADGKDADLVVLDGEDRVAQVYVKGVPLPNGSVQ